MRITCFIKSFAYILFACTLVVQGCSVPSSTAPLIHDIYELRNEHKFNEIIDIHDSYEWSTETDPQRLILYLEAASRTNIDIKARMKAEDAVISQFISGYEDLLFGETHRARTQFENIVRASEHKVWGYVGLLEYSVYINNTNSLYKYLEVLNEFSDINWISKWAKPYYAFQYYYLTNQYNNSLQEIKDYQYPDDYIDYQVIEILIRQNKIERAIEWFSHARNMHGNSISMVEAEANLIATRAGYNKSIKYIENILMHEDSWDIRQVYAFHLLDSDSDESDVRAGKLIYELALERSNDLREIIVAANII